MGFFVFKLDTSSEVAADLAPHADTDMTYPSVGFTREGHAVLDRGAGKIF